MPLDRRTNESRKERLRCRWLRLEFGMELHGQEPRMIGYLDDFDQRFVGAESGERHAVGYKLLPIHVVEFIAVSVPLADLFAAVASMRQTVGIESAGLRAQTHGAPLTSNLLLFIQETDYRVCRVLAEF